MSYTEKDLKFMRTAKVFAEQFVTCLPPSRVIGVVVVKDGQVIGQGVNGPPRGVLHNEDRYIKVDDNIAIMGRGWFYSKHLNKWVRYLEKKEIRDKVSKRHSHFKYIDMNGDIDIDCLDLILCQEEYKTKDIDKQRLVSFVKDSPPGGDIDVVVKDLKCPRYIVGCKSGEKLSMCGCRHAETNACSSAGERASGATMYCYCGVPCVDCAGDIIHAKIKRVFHLDHHPDYSYQSRSWFNEVGIELIEIPQEKVDKNA